MHIALGFFLVEVVEFLRVARSAERADRKSLRLTAREHRRAVRARQQADLAPNIADVRSLSAVGTYALIEYLVADLLFCHVVERVRYLALAPLELLLEVLHDVRLHFVLVLLTLGAIELVERLIELFVGVLADFLFDVLADVIKFDVELFLADSLDYRIYELDLFFDLLVCEEYTAEHLLFGYLARARLDHHYSVGSARYVNVHRALLTLFAVGVDYVLTVDAADDDRARRSRKRYVGYGQRDRAAEHAEYLGRDIGIYRKRGAHDGNVVEQSLREQRAYRAVDEPRREYRLVAAPALAALEAAGYLAYRIQLFFKVDA